MTVALLILHGLLAVALLGAITHQAIAVWAPMRGTAESFVGRMRSVSATSYVIAIIVLYLVTALLGGVIYPSYRINVSPILQQLELNKANGAFELKEHFTVIGLGMLPAYWFFWRQPPASEHARTRAVITAILAFTVWWNFIVGHVLNNIRGFE